MAHGLQDGAESAGARRSLPRRQTTRTAPPDTTDDEAYDHRVTRRPPRGLASKSNSMLSGSQTFGQGRNPANLSGPRFNKPTMNFKQPLQDLNDQPDTAVARGPSDAMSSSSRINVDQLPGSQPVQDLRRPPMRSLKFDDDEEEIEEIVT